MPYLIQKNSEGAVVKQWDLHGGPLTVGRGDQVDAKIEDGEMSRQHFLVAQEGNGYVIEDLKSHNGTWVNGRRVTKAALQPNDRIRAGVTQFVFEEGLGTVIGQLEKERKGYSTLVREISKKPK